MKETVKVITGMVEDMNNAMAEKGFDGLIEAFGNSLAELAKMAMDAAPKLIGIAEDLIATFVNASWTTRRNLPKQGRLLLLSL